jgi:hypothetical protein
MYNINFPLSKFLDFLSSIVANSSTLFSLLTLSLHLLMIDEYLHFIFLTKKLYSPNIFLSTRVSYL